MNFEVLVSNSGYAPISSIIKSHNKKILRNDESKSSKSSCNCKDTSSCPPNGNCLQQNVIYCRKVILRNQYTNKNHSKTSMPFIFAPPPPKKKFRSSPQEVFLGKCILKICSKFTREHPCRSAISIKMQSNFVEITLQHGCSPVNLLHIFRTTFLKNSSGWLLLLFLPSCRDSLTHFFPMLYFFTPEAATSGVL